MNRKIIIIILIMLIVALALIFGFVKGMNDSKVVFRLPSGFVSLDEVITSSEGVLNYVFWESRISFLDANNTNIYQTSVKNSEFIVKYNGKYYILKEKYDELIEKAINSQ